MPGVRRSVNAMGTPRPIERCASKLPDGRRRLPTPSGSSLPARPGGEPRAPLSHLTGALLLAWSARYLFPCVEV